MEQQQDDTMNMNTNTNTNSKSNTDNNSYLCRQSSTRWTPTSEQIKLLKELYYINGVRSPSAEQIQSICSRLRRYGKIEGKNVFYWFQNHKARERQKKKLTSAISSSNTTTITTITTPQLHTTNHNNVFIKNNGGFNLKQDHQDFTFHGFSYSSSSISCGGQLMGSYNHGAVTMAENNFRDCSTSGDLNGENQHVNQWSTTIGTNYNPYAHTSYSNFLIDHKISTINEDPYIEEDHYGVEIESPEIETLPLFPMQNEDHDHSFYTINYASDGACYSDTYQWSSNDSGGNTSLELSLNS